MLFASASALLSACGGGGSSAGSAAAVLTPTVLHGSNVVGDDWITFAHDYSRTGYESQPTGITESNVSGLKLRWSRQLAAGLYTSPLVFGGNVIVTSLTGTVYDLAASTGTVLWQRTIGGEIRATPTIDPANGMVFVGNRLSMANGNPAPSDVFAIHLVDGSIAWQATVNGLTHGSPIVANGEVFVPTAGGDPGSCINGGITALSESTGSMVWRWAVDPNTGGGGSVWGSPAYDGSHLVFGTGNTCETPVPTANGAVALDATGTQLGWTYTAINDSYIDDDTGSGVLLTGGNAVFMNKNGTLYAVNEQTGAKAWSTALGAADGNGGFATPTSDGVTIYAAAGYIKDGASAQPIKDCDSTKRIPVTHAISGYYSKLYAIDQYGAVIWSRQMTVRLDGYVALTGGMGFAGLDDQMLALDSATGKVLWSFTSPNASNFEASPVVVPSGLYAADMGGVVYAFSN